MITYALNIEKAQICSKQHAIRNKKKKTNYLKY